MIRNEKKKKMNIPLLGAKAERRRLKRIEGQREKK